MIQTKETLTLESSSRRDGAGSRIAGDQRREPHQLLEEDGSLQQLSPATMGADHPASRPRRHCRPSEDGFGPLPVIAGRREEIAKPTRNSSGDGQLYQLVEQRFRVFQVWGAEALREPAVDWRQEVAGFFASALVAAESCEARSRTQFPELGALLFGDAQGFAVQGLSGLGMALPQQQLAFVPMQLRREPVLSGSFGHL